MRNCLQLRGSNMGYKTKSVALPPETLGDLNKMAAKVDIPTSEFVRQVFRVAVAREWAGDDLKAHRTRNIGENERKIARMAIPEDLLAKVEKLRGDSPLGTYFRAAFERFIVLHQWG